MKELLPNIYAVPVPKEAHYPYISGNDFLVYFDSKGKRNVAIDDRVENFKILGTVTVDTIDGFYSDDYIKESIDVREYKHGGEVHPKEMYWDYETNSYTLESCDDSFRSLLTSKGLHFTNPYDEKMNVNSEIKGSMVRAVNQIAYREKWQTAQSNLIEKLIIIKKL